MAKAIKKEGEEKYVRDIFLNIKEYAKLVERQECGEDFRPSHFIMLCDKSGKIELPYFLSKEEYDTEAVINIPYMRLAPAYPCGEEELQKVKQMLDEAGITVEITGGKCDRCSEEKTLTETCETCGMEFCTNCIIIKDLEDEHNICFDCMSET